MKMRGKKYRNVRETGQTGNNPCQCHFSRRQNVLNSEFASLTPIVLQRVNIVEFARSFDVLALSILLVALHAEPDGLIVSSKFLIVQNFNDGRRRIICKSIFSRGFDQKEREREGKNGGETRKKILTSQVWSVNSNDHLRSYSTNILQSAWKA
jgi:hypothetical protein